MQITVERITPDWLFRRACEMTMHGQESHVTVDKLARCEHSPLRTIMYWVEITEVASFVSVHLTRHKIGVEHFVKSMRDDLYITKDTVVDRDTPVNHGMFINAHALINLARKRLCYKSHKRTVAVLRKLKRAIKLLDPELAPYLVPECVYRNGFCPELRECAPGLEAVMRAYTQIPTVEVYDASNE